MAHASDWLHGWSFVGDAPRLLLSRVGWKCSTAGRYLITRSVRHYSVTAGGALQTRHPKALYAPMPKWMGTILEESEDHIPLSTTLVSALLIGMCTSGKVVRSPWLHAPRSRGPGMGVPYIFPEIHLVSDEVLMLEAYAEEIGTTDLDSAAASAIMAGLGLPNLIDSVWNAPAEWSPDWADRMVPAGIQTLIGIVGGMPHGDSIARLRRRQMAFETLIPDFLESRRDDAGRYAWHQKLTSIWQDITGLTPDPWRAERLIERHMFGLRENYRSQIYKVTRNAYV